MNNPFPLSSKAQSQVVTAVILGGIIIAGISSAYTWGLPLLRKAQDVDAVQGTLDSMNTLEREIASIAQRGGSSQVSFNIREGSLRVEPENNQIIYETITEAAYVSTGDWVALNENDMQGLEEAGLGDSYGIQGRDKHGIILARAISQGDQFLTTIKLKFRELEDTSTGTHFLFELENNGNLEASEGQHSVIIQQGDEIVEETGSKTDGRLVKQKILIRVS